MTTKRDKAEFRMYCERCTDIQLRNVLARDAGAAYCIRADCQRGDDYAGEG